MTRHTVEASAVPVNGIYDYEDESRWCENCRHWGAERAHDRNMPVGTCHARPPYITRQEVLAYHDPDRPNEPGPLIDRAHWPWTSFDESCAGFSRRRKPAAEKMPGDSEPEAAATQSK